MNPRLPSQPLSPTPAKGSAPRRLRTLGLAFALALFALLLWGKAAHADDGLGPASQEAPATGSADTTDEAVSAEALSASPAAVPETAGEAPAALDDKADGPTTLVVEVPDRVVRSAGETSEATSVAFGAGTAAAAPAMRELPRRWHATVVRARSVTIQAHVAPAVHQCNADTYPTGAGWEASCVVTVENTLGDDGATSSRVTTTWCLAEAGVLPPEGCTTDVTTANSLVTTVNQCNGILAGGSNVTCSVEVVNNVPFGTPTTDVTVNQCIGSGQGGVSPGGPPTDCDPVDSSTSGATVTQCNGSANGGGAPERVQCSVTGGATALPVTVNQCNGSTAAGSTVTCDVRYTNNFAAAVVEPGDTPTTTPTTTPTPGVVPTTPPPNPVVPVSSGPGTGDFGETARSTSSGSSTSTGRSVTDASSSTATSLAATGPAPSTGGVLSLALSLLVLGCLLVAGSKRNACT